MTRKKDRRTRGRHQSRGRNRVRALLLGALVVASAAFVLGCGDTPTTPCFDLQLEEEQQPLRGPFQEEGLQPCGATSSEAE